MINLNDTNRSVMLREIREPERAYLIEIAAKSKDTAVFGLEICPVLD